MFFLRNKKADYQIKDNATNADLPNQLNVGLGVWF